MGFLDCALPLLRRPPVRRLQGAKEHFDFQFVAVALEGCNCSSILCLNLKAVFGAIFRVSVEEN